MVYEISKLINVSYIKAQIGRDHSTTLITEKISKSTFELMIAGRYFLN